MRSASGYGNGRNSTASITLKIALLAPIPRARVKMAMALKPGAFTNIRNAYFRSVSTIVSAELLRPQRLDRIDQGSSSCWQQTRDQGNRGKQHGRSAEQRRIVRRDLIELRRNQPTEGKGRGNSDSQ